MLKYVERIITTITFTNMFNFFTRQVVSDVAAVVESLVIVPIDERADSELLFRTDDVFPDSDSDKKFNISRSTSPQLADENDNTENLQVNTAKLTIDRYTYKILSDLSKNLVSINLSGQNLYRFPFNLPKSLKYLNLKNNEIFHDTSATNVEVLPKFLISLNLSHNSLTVFPWDLPKSLKYLYLNNNMIDGIHYTCPISLISLDLNQNSIKVIPDDLPDNLRCLKLNYNLITKLPSKLPSKLKKITLTGNYLNDLSDVILPERLKFFSAQNCMITKLPVLPGNLITLDVRNNNIEYLPERPSSLIHTYVENNKLEHYNNDLYESQSDRQSSVSSVEKYDADGRRYKIEDCGCPIYLDGYNGIRKK